MNTTPCAFLVGFALLLVAAFVLGVLSAHIHTQRQRNKLRHGRDMRGTV